MFGVQTYHNTAKATENGMMMYRPRCTTARAVLAMSPYRASMMLFGP
jgi:hypothetical protein